MNNHQKVGAVWVGFLAGTAIAYGIGEPGALSAWWIGFGQVSLALGAVALLIDE